MAVYHKWKCVFVQIPKNASSAIHGKLKNRTDDVHSHRSYFEILQDQDSELVESYFTFAVVRNPYDKFVSAFENDGSHETGLDFTSFIKYLVKNHISASDVSVYFIPQYKFISIKNIILMDDLIRYENIQEDWKRIVDKLNSNTNFTKIDDYLEVENATPSKMNKSWEEYYTEETKEIVYNMYKKDFELFGYEK